MTDVLIIGASSFLGDCLHQNLRDDESFNVVGTKFSNESNEYVKYDILNDNINDVVKFGSGNSKYAIICSAISSISMIENNRDIARDFNVIRTQNLIDELTEVGYNIVFISSSSVYSGNSDYDTEDLAPNPGTLYGQTKAEVEDYIKHNLDKYLILRPSKIIDFCDHPKNLLTEWYQNAEKGGSFRAIMDCTLSVVAVTDIANIVNISLKNDMRGIYNLSTGECLERHELFDAFFDVMEIDAHVTSEPLESFNFNKGYPLRNSVSNEKIVKKTGYKFLSYRQIVQKYKQYKSG